MKVSQFIQSVFGTLTQQGSTMLINSEQLLTYVNFALTDVFTYEGRIWPFQYEIGKVITTSGLSSSFRVTIENAETETITRLLSLNAASGTTVLNENVRFINKQDGRINEPREIHFIQDRTFFDVHDVVGNPITYTYSYCRGLKFLTDLDQEIPIPEIFLPALHQLTVSYCSVPYGQYSDGKEVNFYQSGLQKLANLAKGESQQIVRVTTNIA